VFLAYKYIKIIFKKKKKFILTPTHQNDLKILKTIQIFRKPRPVPKHFMHFKCQIEPPPPAQKRKEEKQEERNTPSYHKAA
jgi:hypothetical protein